MKVLEPQQLAVDELTPPSSEELEKINAYWRACNYMCAGMIYLHDNPLLREPLRPEHFKNRLLGHWGSDPGQTFTWVHLNRVIRKFDLNMIYISGPGHGAPAVLSNCYLEGTYSEIYPEKSQDEAGLLKFFRHFPFPANWVAIARRRPRDRSMKVESLDTVCRTRLERHSIIPT